MITVFVNNKHVVDFNVLRMSAVYVYVIGPRLNYAKVL
jgi:hypothetical protein